MSTNQKPGIAWTDVKPNLELRNDHVNTAEIHAIIAHLKTLLVDQKLRRDQLDLLHRLERRFWNLRHKL